MERRGAELALLVALAALLELAAGAGVAYLAGFSRVRLVLGGFQWIWLIALFGALLVSFAGYYYAYRGIFLVEDGPTLAGRQLCAVVAAGFGGFLAHGGMAEAPDEPGQADAADPRRISQAVRPNNRTSAGRTDE